MSWKSLPGDPYYELNAGEYILVDPRWQLTIWEVERGSSDTAVSTTLPVHEFLQDPGRLIRPCDLRIIFAPLDLTRPDLRVAFHTLYSVLSIPREFLTERVQSVSHSFGSQTDASGFVSWFHFLAKQVILQRNKDGSPEVANVHNPDGFELAPLPQADYSYMRSGYVLKRATTGETTLVCFGAPTQVEFRLRQMLDAKAWGEIPAEPYTLFDLVLEGLYLDVDQTVWNMGDAFGPLEHELLALSQSRQAVSQAISFTAIHNQAKHVIYLCEALEACLLLTNSLLDHLSSSPSVPDRTTMGPTGSTTNVLLNRIGTGGTSGMPQRVGPDGLERIGSGFSNETLTEVDLQTQLKEALRYRRSLFQSTRLRLSSLQKRIDNAINLSFNLVTQMDSMIMIRDSSLMRIIAGITMVFLPTTALASVLGSQLFLANWQDSGGWQIRITPIFWTLIYISLPLTLVVLASAEIWHRWNSKRAHRRKSTSRLQALRGPAK